MVSDDEVTLLTLDLSTEESDGRLTVKAKGRQLAIDIEYQGESVYAVMASSDVTELAETLTDWLDTLARSDSGGRRHAQR